MPPKLGIIAGRGALPARIIDMCRDQGRALFVVALEGQADPATVADTPNVWTRLGAAEAAITSLHDAEVAEVVLDESGYTAMWLNDKSAAPPGRLDNLKELINAMAAFERLAGFLDHVALVMELNEAEGGEMVSIMTLHAAKGLEFGTVFLAGWEEGLFPDQRALDESGNRGLEEERRLAYVGMTRAKQELFLLRARRRHLYGTTQHNLASRFLEELPEELIEREYGKNKDPGFTSPFLRCDDTPADHDTRRAERSYSPGTYRVGMKVAHPLFGVGTVRRSDGSGDSEKLVVQFPRVGIKKLVARYAKLKVV